MVVNRTKTPAEVKPQSCGRICTMTDGSPSDRIASKFFAFELLARLLYLDAVAGSPVRRSSLWKPKTTTNRLGP